MKTILPLLVLFACTDVQPAAPDGNPGFDAPALVDAPLDASSSPDSTPTPAANGCHAMPILDFPVLNQGDPLPPEEIQAIVDAINGGFIDSYDETFLPQFVVGNIGGAGTGTWTPGVITEGGGTSKNPGYTSGGIGGLASADAIAVIPFRKGLRLTGAKVLVCGNGNPSVLSVAVWGGPSYSSILSLGGSSTQRGAVVDTAGTNLWRQLTLTNLIGGGPFVPWDTNSGPVAIIITAAAGPTANGVSVGPVTLTWDLLP